MATTYNFILKVSDKEIVSGNTNDDYTITSLDFEKHLYSPCSLNIELSTTKNMSEIVADFSSKSATLDICMTVDDPAPTPTNEEEEETDVTRYTICQDYIIYRFKPVKVGSTLTVSLNLFSRDKLLTLDKFNKVYLNKKLGDGIINGMLGTGGPLADLAVKFNAQKLNLQFMQYTLNGNTVEVIQPYRVQYNEDFHSFISRVSCQCGEILYFEDGMLRLGLTSDTEVSELIGNDITRIEYPTYEQSAIDATKKGVYYSNYVRDFHDDESDYTKAFTADETLKDFPCTDSGAFDEYFDIFDKSDDKLPDQSELYWPDFLFLAMKYVPSFITKQYLTIIDKVTRCGLDIGAVFASYKYTKDDVNGKFKEKVFENKEKNTDSFISEQQSDNDNKISQFADLLKDGFGQLLHDKLFEIRSNEIKSAKEKIIIQLKTSSFIRNSIKLGNKVSFDSNSYIITSCSGRYSATEGITTEIEIVPFRKDESSKQPVFYPPYDECAAHPSVSPQTAVVSADYDPRYQGRVRIRYPWQKSDEKGSPWVRVLTPLASKSGSIHFQLKEGDEVMVGYLDGNIERPYVAGSLFNNDAKLHDSLYSSYDDTIRVGSQRLDFRKGTLTAFVSSFIPFVGTLGQFNPPAAANWANVLVPREDVFEELGFQGLTRLTDANSFWVIEGNTTTRSITIKSALGKITMNAYTGIDIETSGDISIKGKNISISAQNNLTIESGTAIKEDREYEATKATKILKDIAEGVVEDLLVGSIDLSLFRTLWESVVLPKDGTLKIKSNRYLLLEAGKGAACDNEFVTNDDGEAIGNKKFVPASKLSTSSSDLYKDLERAKADIDCFHAAVNEYADRFEELLQAKKAINEFSAPEYEAYALEKNIEAICDTIKTQNLDDLKSWDNIPQHEKFGELIDITGADEKHKKKWQDYIIRLKKALDDSDKADILVDVNLSSYNETIRNKYFDYRNKDQSREDAKTNTFHDICSSYITASEILKMSKKATWDKSVDSIDVQPAAKTKWEKFKYGAATVLGPYIETFHPSNEYAFSKNKAEGRIIMSQNEKESIIFTNGHTLDHTDNDIFKAIKDALKKGFPG